MSKLTKDQAKAHRAACALLQKDRLTLEEREFVLDNWHEAAEHMNGLAGAFFTPSSLARDLAVEVNDGSVIDLCAGIGRLAFELYHRDYRPGAAPRFVCVEINPDYVAVGRKVLPEAEWICADALNLPADIGRFRWAVANPPFGAAPRAGKSPRYAGRRFEYHVIDVASDLADFGAFIIPQTSTPFRYSGLQTFEQRADAECQAFERASGIKLEMNCGLDTSHAANDWRFKVPVVEIACVDFNEARAQRRPMAVPAGRNVSAPAPVVTHRPTAQLDLFGTMAA